MDVYHKEDKEEPDDEKYENETSQEGVAEEDALSMALDAGSLLCFRKLSTFCASNGLWNSVFQSRSQKCNLLFWESSTQNVTTSTSQDSHPFMDEWTDEVDTRDMCPLVGTTWDVMISDDYIDSFEKEEPYVMDVPTTPVEEYHPTKKIDKT